MVGLLAYTTCEMEAGEMQEYNLEKNQPRPVVPVRINVIQKEEISGNKCCQEIV